MRRRSSRVRMLVVLVPILLTACSGMSGGTTSPASYVSAVCSHTKAWLTDIQLGFRQMEGAAKPGTSPQKGKALLRSFFDRAVSDTDGMIGGIRDAGLPDISNGRSLATSLLAALERGRSALETARKQVDDLPTNSVSAFQRAASSLGTRVQDNMRGVGSAIGRLRSPQLEQAARSAPACRGVV